MDAVRDADGTSDRVFPATCGVFPRRLTRMRRFRLAARLELRFDGEVTPLEQLIAELRGVCASLPDRRKAPRRDGDYTMADIGLSAFSVFFMGSPSFLGH